MNSLTISKDILIKLLDEKALKKEIADYLNSLIDEELVKDIPDCDFIDECIQIIDDLENDNYTNVIPFIQNNKSKYNKKLISILIASAIIFSVSIGAVAINNFIVNDKNKKENNTTETTLSETTIQTTTVTSTAESTTETTQKTETSVYESGIALEFEKEFKDEYYVGEKFDSNGISVYIELSDGSRDKVSLSKCKILKDENFGKTEKIEIISIIYEKFKKDFSVRVIRNADTKALNSIYATFPNGFDFTANNLENIDLSIMEVVAVYSDNSEEVISSDKYKIDKEKINNKTVLITVTYEGCSTSFGIKERR